MVRWSAPPRSLDFSSQDAVFAVLDSLIVEWPQCNDEEEAQALGFKTPYTKIHYDFKLAPE